MTRELRAGLVPVADQRAGRVGARMAKRTVIIMLHYNACVVAGFACFIHIIYFATTMSIGEEIKIARLRRYDVVYIASPFRIDALVTVDIAAGSTCV